MKVELVTHTPSPEYNIELAYLRCRNLDPEKAHAKKDTGDRIEQMWSDQHFSPFEFADATFNIEGVSRTCSHQFVRHRIASYEQLSMRHVSPDELKFIVPPSYVVSDEALSIAQQKFDISRDVYDFMITYKVPKQDSRFLIPMGIETMFYAKMNFRSWLHFLHLRTSPKAQWEIRQVANEILETLREIAPNVFDEKYRNLWAYV